MTDEELIALAGPFSRRQEYGAFAALVDERGK